MLSARIAPEGQKRSRKLYYILLLFDEQALQLFKPVPASEGYRAWKVLLGRIEPDRPGRHDGQLQELIGSQFAATILEASQRGLSDAQLQMRLVLHAARLSSKELARQGVQGVLRYTIASYPQQPTSMEIGFADKRGKETGKGEGKGKGKWQPQKGKGQGSGHQKSKDREPVCYRYGKTGQAKQEHRSLLKRRRQDHDAADSAAAAASQNWQAPVETAEAQNPEWIFSFEVVGGRRGEVDPLSRPRARWTRRCCNSESPSSTRSGSRSA